MVRLPSGKGGVGSRSQAVGRAIGGFKEVGKDTETHEDKIGVQPVTVTLTFKMVPALVPAQETAEELRPRS